MGGGGIENKRRKKEDHFNALRHHLSFHSGEITMITPDCEELADSQFRVVCSVLSCPIQPWEERALAGEGAASRQVASAGRSEAGAGPKSPPFG